MGIGNFRGKGVEILGTMAKEDLYQEDDVWVET